MLKYALSFCILMGILSSCDHTNKESGKTVQNQADDAHNQTEPITTDFRILSSVSFNIDINGGSVVFKKFWQDRNGQNAVLFTTSADTLYARHYIQEKKIPKLIREVFDFVGECDADLTSEYISEMTQVTDLNSDDIGEITFAYKRGCISDLSPLELKLLMITNGDKYIIRGNTLIQLEDYKVGGDKTSESSWQGVPSEFRSHMNDAWSRTVELTAIRN